MARTEKAKSREASLERQVKVEIETKKQKLRVPPTIQTPKPKPDCQ